MSRHPHLLDAGSCAILVVDVQEAFRTHIAGFEEMVASIELLLRGSRPFEIPVGWSEQYPAGLGSTVEELRPLLPADAGFEKVEISSLDAPGWATLPRAVREAQQLIVVGIETHVCISQTVHGLLHAGRTVHVPVDAVSSRSPRSREVALERLRHEGAVLTTVESALFELAQVAGTKPFREMQREVKEHDGRVANRAALN